MIKEFQSLTPEEGREMVRASGVLLLPNWDIENALIFNSISNKLEELDQNKKEISGAKFSVDQAALVIWSIRKASRTMSLQSDSFGLIGNLIVKRVKDTNFVEAAHLGVETSQLTLATTGKDENKTLELQAKYKRALEPYNKEVQKRIELENKVMGRYSRPRTTYPRPPVEPF